MALLKAATLAALIVLTRPPGARAAEGIALGLHEARELVERAPQFLRAAEAGECPQTSDASVNSNIATIVVRGGCGAYSWIADLYVDLSTGTVTTDAGRPGPRMVETAEMARLRNQLFAARARERILADEALCLLKRVPMPAGGGSCQKATLIREGSAAFWGTVENTCGSSTGRPLEFAVDRLTAEVRNAGTEERYRTEPLDRLSGDLRVLHSAPRLTGEDARRLAESPPVAQLLIDTKKIQETSCVRAEIEGLGTANEVWVQVSRCGSEPPASARLAINVTDASVRLIGSNVELRSPALLRLGQKALAEAKARIDEAAAAVRRACE
jgi:hypothetical protein